MSALDIPPHPRRTARLALGVLALIAAAGFAEGFLKQLEIQAPPGPPPTGGVSAVAEATPAPAPALQVMEPSRPHRAAPPPDLTAAVGPAPDAAVSTASAQAAPAADAAAVAPETPDSAPASNSPPANPPAPNAPAANAPALADPPA